MEINPADPDNWTQLVTFYLQAKRPTDVERTFREAHLALDDEYLPLLTGKYYELQSRWQEAEDIYLSAFADRMDEIPVARRMAEFYLMWVKSNPENRGKAARYLNRILRASYEGQLPPTDPTAAWGRRQAAQQLATSGDYQDSLKAEQMLNETIQSGAASLEDREQLVDVLSLRDDPGSRERAVAMLRQMKQERGLPPERELHLGHALFDLGEWDAAKAQMQEAIGRYPQYAGLQTAYISMLIQRKELEEARLRISRLETLKDAAAVSGAGQLRLDLAAASGNKQEVRSVLTKMTPNLRVVTQQQLEFLGNLAQLADKVGDYEYALKLMTEYARRVPGSELAMARLTALHGDLQQGVNMLKQSFDSDIDNTLSVALEVLRARRSEAPQMLDDEVNAMIRKSLRDDPESARRLVMEAEALEIQEKFEEAIAAYAKVLARDDVPKPIRAMAANNMAFLVALKSQKPEDLDLALKAVNEAVQSLGPTSDILDTRALVYLARGQNAEAVADMKLAVKMKLTPSKSYHLAQALFAAGDLEGAVAAWQRAKADGLGPDKVSQLELEKLEQFTRQIESARIPVKR